MKTFIAALIIFALLCILVFSSSYLVKEKTEKLLNLASSLPGTKEGFREEKELALKTAVLCSLWAKNMRFFPYIISYDMLDRADDAALALSTAAESECEEDFLSARLRFIDAVARISRIFSFSAEGVF